MINREKGGIDERSRASHCQVTGTSTIPHGSRDSDITRLRLVWPGSGSAEEQADALGISYSTVCRWLRQFREEGMPGLSRLLSGTAPLGIMGRSRV